MDVDSLYSEKTLDDYIISQCWRKSMDYDDTKQDIFVEVIESGASSVKECKKIADAYFRREFYKTNQQTRYTDIDMDSISDDKDYRGFDGVCIG